MRKLVSPRLWPIWEICPQTQKGTVIFRTERSLRCLSLLPTLPLRAKPAYCHRRGNGALWVDLSSLTGSLDPIYNTPLSLSSITCTRHPVSTSLPPKDTFPLGLGIGIVPKLAYPVASAMPKPWQIFFASLSGISVCRGTASTAPVCGLHHSECLAPSRLR